MTYKEFLNQGGEKKWQDKWLADGIDRAKDFDDKPKKYVLDMFPYPSGAGLHVGHPEGYTATDIYSRYFRLKGFNVLHPMGWDAFGLPAENYAIKTGTQPSITTAENVAVFKRQIQALGFSYDWEREINTTDPKYYKWTQWIFLQLFKRGLAYEATVPINWCPSCKTGLSNEEVKNGICDRCGSKVERRDMRQWMLKITAYADRLLAGLDKLDWPESIKTQQRNWIGRSEGAIVKFPISNFQFSIEVYTTRPDTLFGATYMVIAPEHELVQILSGKISNLDEVNTYIAQAKNKSDLERTDLNKEKTGIEIKDIKAINPVNGKEIPVWLSDYVLSGYGTGAIMAVPAHDERDFEFAIKFNLPITQVIIKDKKYYKSYLMGTEDLSDKELSNLGISIIERTQDGDRKIIIPESSIGNYEALIINKLKPGFWNEYLRDKVFFIFKLKNGEVKKLELSNDTAEEIDKLAAEFNNKKWEKQSPWGWLAENIFYADYILNTDTNSGEMVNSDFLNGLVPADAIKKMTAWLEERGVGKMAVNYKLRDWVFSRQRYWGEPIPLVHCDKCGIAPIDEKDLPLTLPEVDKYEPTGTGESPLATIDAWVNTTCPKCGGPAKRETNTMPQWAGSSWYWLRYIDPENDKAFADPKKLKYWLPVDLYLGGAEHAVLHLLYARFWNMVLFDIEAVPFEEPFTKLVNQGLILGEDGEKMSKSRGNVVNPDDIVKEFGADTFRMFEMFIGPLEDMKPWSTKNILGVNRFLGKVWELSSTPPFSNGGFGCDHKEHRKGVLSSELEILFNQTIKKVGEDIENMSFNTAISSMMILVNAMQEAKSVSTEYLDKLLIILSPFAPHLAEELWKETGHKKSIFAQEWPAYDPDKITDAEIELPVQVNGKVRAKLKLPADVEEAVATKAALADPMVQKYVMTEPKKIIYIKGKMISIVV